MGRFFREFLAKLSEVKSNVPESTVNDRINILNETRYNLTQEGIIQLGLHTDSQGYFDAKFVLLLIIINHRWPKNKSSLFLAQEYTI